AACGCSPTPRSPRWSRRRTNATSSSACSPARAAPGTSAGRGAPPPRGGGCAARAPPARAGAARTPARRRGWGARVWWRPAGERELTPADTTLKVSALIGPVNPASYALYERLGADSVNVPSDLTLGHLTEIRRVSGAPMDMYIEAPDDLGGYVRMYEVAEL